MEHEYFGWVDTTAPDEAWAETAEVGDQSVDVRMTAHGGPPSAASLDSAALLVAGLDNVDANLREHFVGLVSEKGSAVVEFLDAHLDDLVALRPRLVADDSGDLAIDVIRSLTMLSVRIDLGARGEQPFATVAFALDEDDATTLLIAHLDIVGAVSGLDVVH